MAVGLVLQRVIDEAISDPLATSYATVKANVGSASTIADVVDSVGLYQTLTADQETEARAVLKAMPPSLNAAIRAALINAFQRDLSIRVTWVEITQGLMHAHFEESPDGTTLLIQLWTRDGYTYLTRRQQAARGRARGANWVAELTTAQKRTAKRRATAKKAPAKRTVKKSATAKRAPAKRSVKKRATAKRSPAKKRATRRR
jgi:hypothetical protein